MPDARARLCRERFGAADQRIEAGRYYALYHLNPNWKDVSRNLYQAGETEALQIARAHIQTVTGKLYIIYACTPLYVYIQYIVVILWLFILYA